MTDREHQVNCNLREKTGDECSCVEDSCGCTFCDVGLKPRRSLGGRMMIHETAKGMFPCTRSDGKREE